MLSKTTSRGITLSCTVPAAAETMMMMLYDVATVQEGDFPSDGGPR